MAAESYIQIAMAQVQSALSDLQQQVHAMQQQTNGLKHQLQQEIAALEHERTTHESSMNHLQDASQRHALQVRVDHINQACNDKRAQMNQLDIDLARTAQRKNNLAQRISGTLNQLSQFRASPDMHL